MRNHQSLKSSTLSYDKDTNIDIVLPCLSGANREQLLHNLAAAAAEHIPASPADIYEQLKDKEAEASSGIGEGVAIPTLKVASLPGAKALFTKLERPVEFNAIDGKPVDIICLLCCPEERGPLHLRRLSRLSRLFRNKELCDIIRTTQDIQTVQNLIHNPEGWMMAA